MKKCNKCNVEKDLNCFFYRKDTNKYRNECKECHCITNKKYYYENGGREADSKRKSEYKLSNPEVHLLKSARERAKEKNIPFDITADDVIIPETCPVLGIPLKAGEKIVCHNSPTIDRIKPELGYVKGNIQVISYRANTLKNNATIEELEKVLEHLRKIV